MENQPGALSRVIGVFSQRAFNIESLSVAPTDDKTLSRLTITTNGDAQILEQIEKQLNKLIDVLKISEVTDGEHVEREIMLVKLKAKSLSDRSEIKRTVDIFRGQIVDVTKSLYMVQLVGTSDKLDAFLNAIVDATDIVEVVRSGIVGLARSDRILHY